MITPNGERIIGDKVIRRAIMEVAPELLLEWLKFEGGIIREIRLARTDNVEIVIEHEDMPDWRQGDSLDHVRPQYQIEYPSNTIVRLTPRREDKSSL